MNITDNTERQKPRRTYRKPALTQVELRPEEAVLGFCKSAVASGPGKGACNAAPACPTTGS
jgi:hypothetical protein